MEHKLQSSTELIILTGVIVAFSVAAIAVYLHFGSLQKTLYQDIGSMTANAPPIGANVLPGGQVNLYASAPSSVTTGKSGQLYLIVSAPGMAVSLKGRAYGYGTTVYPSNYSANENGFGILEFLIMPVGAGLKTVVFHATVLGDNVTMTKNITLQFYAGNGTASSNVSTGTQSFSAGIARRSEQINYHVSAPSQISGIQYWSHCTYHDFWSGGVESEPNQCGQNTWGFDSWDPMCNPFIWNGQDRYYCFSNLTASFNISTIQQARAYSFNVVASIKNISLDAHSNLNSVGTDYPLLGTNGTVLGRSEVSRVYGTGIYPAPYSSYVLVGGAGGNYPIGYGFYSNYTQERNTLLQDLETFNGSNIGGQLEYTLGLISFLNNSVLLMKNAKEINVTGCAPNYGTAGNEYYSCNAVEPLDYNIDSVLTGNYPGLNQTVYVGGSTVIIT